MYDRHNIFTYTDPNFAGHFQFTDAMPPSAYHSTALLPTSLLIPEQLAGSEFDWVKSEIGNSSGASGCSSYYDGSPSSLASQCTQRTSLMQRSVSSHSFPTNGVHQPVLTAAEFLESGSATVRRVCSTGDLQVGFQIMYIWQFFFSVLSFMIFFSSYNNFFLFFLTVTCANLNSHPTLICPLCLSFWLWLISGLWLISEPQKKKFY